MSESDQQECPACGAADTTSYPDLDAVLCEECGLAISEVGEPASISIPSDRNHSDEQEMELRWDAEVSLQDSSERNLVELLRLVESLTDQLPGPEAFKVETAKRVTNAWKVNYFHGRSMEAGVGAAFCSVTREQRKPVPMNIIAEAVGVDQTALKRRYRSLLQELGLSIAPTDAADYVWFFSERLHMTEKETTRAVAILNEAGSCPGNPVGHAGAAVYMTTDRDPITYKRVGDIGGLTKETIWRSGSRLRKRVNSG